MKYLLLLLMFACATPTHLTPEQEKQRQLENDRREAFRFPNRDKF